MFFWPLDEEPAVKIKSAVVDVCESRFLFCFNNKEI
jgi:hypothetical protein